MREATLTPNARGDIKNHFHVQNVSHKKALRLFGLRGAKLRACGRSRALE
jgi:hypothetical protein